MSLRRHHRFDVAVVLTIIAIAWIAVPAVTRLVETVGSYDPGVYEPKDRQRGEWIASNSSLALKAMGWETLLKLALFVAAALAWLVASASRGGGRPGGAPGASTRSRPGASPPAPSTRR